MGVALVDERHRVMVGVDVKPGAAVAQAIGQAHAQHVACRTRSGRPGRPVSKLTWPSLRGRKPGSAVVERAMSGRRSSSSRKGISSIRFPSGVGQARSAVAASRSNSTPAARGGAAASSSDTLRRSSKPVWSWPGSPADQLQASTARSRSAGSARSAGALGLGQPELHAPPGGRLVQVGDAQATWSMRRIDDHAPATRSASSSGMARATCKVLAETSG